MTEETFTTNHTNNKGGAKPKYAGFWMRFWAYLTDLIIILCINAILLSPLKFFQDIQLDIGIWSLGAILGSMIFYLYFLLMTKFFHQTLGKMIFGLKVTRKDGLGLRWSDLIFREVIGRFLHRVFPVTILLYIIVAFTRQKQGIHDMIADTAVIPEE